MAHAPGSMVLLTRLSRVVYRRATPDVLGMRLKQFVGLSYMRHSAMTQRELGECMMVDANNVVLLLNELESSGWAERRRDPEDRRRHIVAVTPAGLEALERAERALDDLEDQVLEGLGGDERAALRALLERALRGVPAAH